jgi:hypothetical protein
LELPDVTDTAALVLPTARRGERSDPDRPETPRQHRWRASRADDLPGGLAAIGLADEQDELDPVEELEIADREDVIPSHRAAPAEPEPSPLPVAPGAEESRPISVRRLDRSDRTYGDRVDGWVRPEYHDDRAEPPAGEYWTPLPMDDLGLEPPDDDPEPSARGYGWPLPVERLPAVPDYEPATGFDLTPVATEPTELVPAWPPMPDQGAETSRTRGADGSSRGADRRSPAGERATVPPANDNPEAELPVPPAQLPGEPDLPGEQTALPPEVLSSPGEGSGISGGFGSPGEGSGISGGFGSPGELGRLPGDVVRSPIEHPDPSGEHVGLQGEPVRLPTGSPALPNEPLDHFSLAAERFDPVGEHPVLNERSSRIRLPNAWTGRDLKPTGNRFLENEPHRPTPADTDQRFRAPTGEPERRRPRPRPRPAATTADNVYVSRHAADPPH